MTDGVITFSATGELLVYNPPAAEYLAPVADLALGQCLGEEIILPSLEDSVKQVATTGKAQGTEFKLQDRVLVARLAPLTAEGTVRAVVCVLLT